MCTVMAQVVHFDLPKDSESFLHRSGRTGRAGKSGTTIAMFRPNESGYFRRIVRDVGAKNVEFIGPPGPQAVMSASAKQVRMFYQLCWQKQRGLYRRGVLCQSVRTPAGCCCAEGTRCKCHPWPMGSRQVTSVLLLTRWT